MNTPDRQAARSRGQRLSVDRAGLGSTGGRRRAPSDIPAASRDYAGHAGQKQRRLGLPEERPACARGSLVVVVVNDHTLRVRVHRIAKMVETDAETARVRLWMGRAFGRREVRWSHTARAIPAEDVVRRATPREVDLGRIA